MYSKSTAGVVQTCVQSEGFRAYVQQKYGGCCTNVCTKRGIPGICTAKVQQVLYKRVYKAGYSGHKKRLHFTMKCSL